MESRSILNFPRTRNLKLETAPARMTLARDAAHCLVGLKAHPQPPLLRLRHPVVLMHGFGMMAGFGREGHLHREALHLRERGVRAFAPNITPYTPLAERTRQWQQRLTRILDATGAAKLNLIAHSTGGLDARHLISTKGWHAHVATLTTVSTPHRGASLAALVLALPGPLRRLLARLFERVGAAAHGGARPDVATALRELTPRHVTGVFDPATPDHPDVAYQSFAAAAGKEARVSISPFFAVQNRMIYQREGRNDGVVSVRSARRPPFRGVLDCDHGEQIGLRVLPGRPFRARAFYASLAEELADDGF